MSENSFTMNAKYDPFTGEYLGRFSGIVHLNCSRYISFNLGSINPLFKDYKVDDHETKETRNQPHKIKSNDLDNDKASKRKKKNANVKLTLFNNLQCN